MSHKVFRGIVLLTLLALPIARSPARIGSQTTIAERVAALEEFRQQQRDWNSWIDLHITANANDLMKAQGVQDAQSAALAEKLGTVYARQMVVLAFGNVGAIILAVGTPIAWNIYTRRHRKMMAYQRKLERIFKALGYELPTEDDDSAEE